MSYLQLTAVFVPLDKPGAQLELICTSHHAVYPNAFLVTEHLKMFHIHSSPSVPQQCHTNPIV